jgi:N4-gp56 family major capsid protein
MGDVLTGLTEVDVTIEQIVSATVQQVLTAEAVVFPLVQDFSNEVGPGMDTVKIPKFGNFTVNTKVENVAVEAQANTFDSDNLALDQHKVIQWLLEDIASLQAKVNLTQAYVTQAAKDLAAEMDQYVLDVMEAGVSTSAPDHKRAYAGSTIAKADILLARQLLNTAKVPMAGRSAVISPAEEASLLNISEFVRIDESGGSEALRNGRIGRLFGFDIYMSPQAEDAKSMFFHMSCQAFARQLAPRYQTQPDLANLGERHSIDHIYGSKTLDSGKRQVLLGTA